MGPAQLGLASWKWERLDRRLWEIQQEASKSSSEKPSRGTFPAATGLPPAPLRIPRAGKTGRRLGHGRGGGLGRWARESPLVGRKHPWVSRPGGQMQGNSGLRKHPALPPPPPGTGGLPSAFLFRISIYYPPLPSAWPHLPANLIIHFLLTAGASWSPDLREQGNQAVAPPCVLELFSKAPGFSCHPPIATRSYPHH